MDLEKLPHSIPDGESLVHQFSTIVIQGAIPGRGDPGEVCAEGSTLSYRPVAVREMSPLYVCHYWFRKAEHDSFLIPCEQWWQLSEGKVPWENSGSV